MYNPTTENPVHQNWTIEGFLGEEICNHPLVLESKLTIADKQLILGPISLQELTEQLKTTKNCMAPGPDGVGYRFIKKFWKILEPPLVNYIQTATEKNILTQSFRGASITLIPKKGGEEFIKTGGL